MWLGCFIEGQHHHLFSLGLLRFPREGPGGLPKSQGLGRRRSLGILVLLTIFNRDILFFLLWRMIYTASAGEREGQKLCPGEGDLGL